MVAQEFKTRMADQYDDDGDNGSQFPAVTAALTARVVTLVSLIVSVVLLTTIHTTTAEGFLFTYRDFRSYQYMFYVTVFGIGYTLLQISFAVYYMGKKQHLMKTSAFLNFNLYADKAMIVGVATGVGAAFGATVDINNLFVGGSATMIGQLATEVGAVFGVTKDKNKHAEDDITKFKDFLTLLYFPTTFLLVGCVACLVSSVYSPPAPALPR